MYEIINTVVASDADLLRVDQQVQKLGVLAGLPVTEQLVFATVLGSLLRTTAPHASHLLVHLESAGDNDFHFFITIKDGRSLLSAGDRDVHDAVQSLVGPLTITLSNEGLVTSFRIRHTDPGSRQGVSAITIEKAEAWKKQLQQEPVTDLQEIIRQKERQLLGALVQLKESEDCCKDLAANATALEQKTGELQRSNEELEQFAYIASHDLQEPLRKISFYSDSIREKYGHDLPAEITELMGKAVRATDRMKSLIREVLDYSLVRHEQDMFAEVSLDAIMQEVREEFELVIRDKQATLEIAPLPVLEANTFHMLQLFENLVGNALKYAHPDVPPHVRVHSQMDGEKMKLFVEDNGVGFDDAYKNRMFQLFQRLHGRDQFQGTGIGLAICKKITDLHNGDIEAYSTPGKGATFVITLPLRQPAVQ